MGDAERTVTVKSVIDREIRPFGKPLLDIKETVVLFLVGQKAVADAVKELTEAQFDEVLDPPLDDRFAGSLHHLNKVLNPELGDGSRPHKTWLLAQERGNDFQPYLDAYHILEVIAEYACNAPLAGQYSQGVRT